MSKVEIAIALLRQDASIGRIWIRWPLDESKPMEAAITLSKDTHGTRVIAQNGPTPNCNIQSWELGNGEFEVEDAFQLAEEWMVVNKVQ